MLLRFSCPGCKEKVSGDNRLILKNVFCPHCRISFPLRLPEGTAAPRDEEVLTDLGTSAGQSDDSPLGDFAGRTGINLDEVGTSSVANAAEASQALQALQRDLPAVESAYRPSGAMGPSALGYMLLGIPIGAAAGALAASATGVVAGLVAWGLVRFIVWLANTCDMMCCLTILVTVLEGLIAAAIVSVAIIVFAVAGMCSALCITSLGKAGNNRNATWPALFSLVAGLLTSGLLWFVFQAYGTEFVEKKIFKVEAENLDRIYQVTIVVGALIAMLAGAFTARKGVQGAKFCEDCHLYMEPSPLGALRQGALKVLVRALNQSDMPTAVEACSRGAGTDGTVTLFHCRQCEQGYIEATAQFKASWKGENSTVEESETWLVASKPLGADDVKRFKPFVTGNPST